MAEDDDISRRYRELPREEPPRHLDEAIRAAARRAVGTRPAPLVVPSGRQRWYFPVAAAAIIVLAVAVTMHVERQQPAEEVVEMKSEPKSEPASSPASPAPETIPEKAEAPLQANSERKLESPASRALREAAPAPAAPAPSTAPAPSAALPQRAEGMSRDSSQLAKLAARSPEQWLQGIADLRAQGRHDEADKELAEFRKRYPDYRISEAMREKVENSAR